MVEPENLILTMLRRLDEKFDRVIDDVRDLKARVTALDEGQAALQHGMASITEGMAGIHRRIDRVDSRLERIERRLDLVDVK